MVNQSICEEVTSKLKLLPPKMVIHGLISYNFQFSLPEFVPISTLTNTGKNDYFLHIDQ